MKIINKENSPPELFIIEKNAWFALRQSCIFFDTN
jgi:hypothetical protein